MKIMTERMMITGSRTITDKKFIFKCLNSVFLVRKFNLLIHGGARGVDLIAERWAKENGIAVLYFTPDWNKYGIDAGKKRNTSMAEYCDFGVAIWDGKSGGTSDAMKKLRRRRKLFKVFKTEQMVSVSGN